MNDWSAPVHRLHLQVTISGRRQGTTELQVILNARRLWHIRRFGSDNLANRYWRLGTGTVDLLLSTDEA